MPKLVTTRHSYLYRFRDLFSGYICFGVDRKKMRKFLVGSLLFIAAASWAQESHEGPVKWMSFEQAVEKSKTEKRKIFIDVYTDWCGWCKVMDKNTFSEPNVAKILNEKFYPVKLDAEQREDIVFNGTTFKFIPAGNSGTHQLALALLNNQPSYPTVVFLTEDFAMIQPMPGYQKPEDFHKVIQFIGEDHFKKMKWAEWQTVYKSPYTSGNGPGK
jgi:thioredoxin-related protein